MCTTQHVINPKVDSCQTICMLPQERLVSPEWQAHCPKGSHIPSHVQRRTKNYIMYICTNCLLNRCEVSSDAWNKLINKMVFQLNVYLKVPSWAPPSQFLPSPSYPNLRCSAPMSSLYPLQPFFYPYPPLPSSSSPNTMYGWEYLVTLRAQRSTSLSFGYATDLPISLEHLQVLSKLRWCFYSFIEVILDALYSCWIFLYLWHSQLLNMFSEIRTAWMLPCHASSYRRPMSMYKKSCLFFAFLLIPDCHPSTSLFVWV